MPYIITPSINGWGYWEEHLERGKITVQSESQKLLLSEAMRKNPYEGGCEEVCFDILNPCSSDHPAEYFYRALNDGHETLHPLIVLAACAAWKGDIPAQNFNVASPHLMVDEKGNNLILLLQHRNENGNVLSLIPTDQWVQRPGYIVGISSSSYAYQHYNYPQISTRISL
jgi:hypothetical protein